MFFAQKGRVASALLAAVVLAACSTDALAPDPTGNLQTALGPSSTGIANSVRYSDTGIKPATGRSGSAGLQLRALLGADGNTHVEATSLNAVSAAAGNIDKIQLKVLVGSTATENFNGLKAGSSWSGTVAGLSRADELQLQANISGIDAKRVGVVTVKAPVALRPDLAVTSVAAPASAAPQTMVTVSAAVTELNGDVGASADCELFVDGVKIDEATGIWIDAGDSASCQFSTTFAAAGTYELTIAASNVNPGDWDTSNNSAGTTITITSPGSPVQHGGVQAARHTGDYFSSTVNTGGYYPLDRYTEQHWDYSYAYAWGTSVDAGELPSQRVDAKLTTNGSVAYNGSLPLFQSGGYNDGYYFSNCSYNSSMGDWAQSCVYGYHGGQTYSDYWYQKLAGTVTYFGHEYYCEYWGCNSYTWNNNDVYSGGIPWNIGAGSTVRMELAFVGADEAAYTIDRTVDLDQSSPNSWSDSSCTYDSYRGGQTCWNHQQSYVTHFGQVNW